MKATLQKIFTPEASGNVVILTSNADHLSEGILNQSEIHHITENFEKNKMESFDFNKLDHWVFVRIIKSNHDSSKVLESFRKSGDELQAFLNSRKQTSLTITGAAATGNQLLAFAEGMALGNYQFIKYLHDKSGKENSLNKIGILSDEVNDDEIVEINMLVSAVSIARDLVNEPAMQLSAVKMAETFATMAKEAGIHVEVFNKKKIESLKMGGLLAVNTGSIDPPTFTVMEWKPKNAHNDKPLIFVGKGVTYDTGGLNIKTGKSMENMKSDMSGAAMMASAIYAAAKARLPLHIVALIPATDNRLNGNAYVSGDIITMHNGLTVEIINTDAEGRLILADALSYAKKYNPELVIDAATLTGSAQRAIGKFGVVAMQTKATEEMEELKKSGNAVYERVAEFPFWDEYADLMKSDIADLVNAGPPEAGMITAGKFLEKFTDYPYIHLDIAGVAFAESRDSYRGLGGTGFGVRLLFDFLKKQS
ncbi:MAG: leucyl aminopeptidase [Bacteroidales bacterium]|nr:leucyl aminopeptidase [Bacteroidales bacterium]